MVRLGSGLRQQQYDVGSDSLSAFYSSVLRSVATTRVHGPGAFLTPVNSGRQLGCQKNAPEFTGRQLGP